MASKFLIVIKTTIMQTLATLPNYTSPESATIFFMDNKFSYSEIHNVENIFNFFREGLPENSISNYRSRNDRVLEVNNFIKDVASIEDDFKKYGELNEFYIELCGKKYTEDDILNMDLEQNY